MDADLAQSVQQNLLSLRHVSARTIQVGGPLMKEKNYDADRTSPLGALIIWAFVGLAMWAGIIAVIICL